MGVNYFATSDSSLPLIPMFPYGLMWKIKHGKRATLMAKSSKDSFRVRFKVSYGSCEHRGRISIRGRPHTEVDTKSPAHALVIALTLISESGPKIV